MSIRERLQARLHEEFSRKGISVRELLDASGLPIDRSTMHRKIHCDSAMTLDEMGATAKALGLRLTFQLKSAA